MEDVTQQSEIIGKALEFAKEDSKGRDPSHDFFHIQRVLGLATIIAKKENLLKSLEIIQLGAILHDVNDYKYSSEGPTAVLTAFFEKENYPKEKADVVVSIVDGLGFHKELEGKAPKSFPELAVVSDADRLDAIGAFGIARCFSYGAIKDRAILDPSTPYRENITQEEYMKKGGPSINHFYEKLLKLKDTMKTETGRQMAQDRHKFMEDFLTQIHQESQVLNSK